MSFKTTLFVSFTIGAFASALALAARAPEPTYVSQSYAQIHAKGLVRTKESKKFLKSAPRKSFSNIEAAIPGQYNLKGHVGPVEDQGQCGSCWDFSLTETLRGTLMAQGNDPGRLSFNYLLNCATMMQGCDGGDFQAADLFVAPKGAPAYGSDGDYIQANGKCEQAPAVASAKSYKLLGSDGGANPGSPTPSFKDIAYVVGVLHQPVSVDVAADDNWEKYSWGIYNSCSSEDPGSINHMVVIEGYDCEDSLDASGNCKFDQNGNLPKGTGIWIVKNSWGSGWGWDGYIHMRATDAFGKPCNAIATDALYYDVSQ
jgi:C1A family cysteine protease